MLQPLLLLVDLLLHFFVQMLHLPVAFSDLSGTAKGGALEHGSNRTRLSSLTTDNAEERGLMDSPGEASPPTEQAAARQVSAPHCPTHMT